MYHYQLTIICVSLGPREEALEPSPGLHNARETHRNTVGIICNEYAKSFFRSWAPPCRHAPSQASGIITGSHHKGFVGIAVKPMEMTLHIFVSVVLGTFCAVT